MPGADERFEDLTKLDLLGVADEAKHLERMQSREATDELGQRKHPRGGAVR